MVRRAIVLSFAVAITCAFGQFPGQYPPGRGYPPGGQYPGGRYPGGQYPGRTRGPGLPLPRREKKDAAKKPAEEDLKSLRGNLRRLDEKQVVIEMPDKRIIRVDCAEITKYKKGEMEIKPSELQPGDHLWIEASQDDQGGFHAVRVNLEKAGTPAERAAAGKPLDEIRRMSDDDAPPVKTTHDDGRPVMRRAGAEPKRETPAEVTAANTKDSKPAEEPEERVADIRAIEKPSDPDPDEKPRVKRGVPVGRKPGSRPEVKEEIIVAEARAPEVLRPAETRTIAPNVERVEAGTEPAAAEDPFIEKARTMAESFVETLPNYTVKQLTTRFVSVSKANWQPQDNIQSDLVYENGREHYRNVMLNGKASKGKVEETGAWSTGEFGTVLRDLFSMATNADFRQRGTATISNRLAKVYTFTVEQPNSHWQLSASAQTYKPAYRGTVWIDKETARVLRIEMQTRNLPKEFPLDTAESATDYEFIRIGEQFYLVPVHSEVLSCIRGASQCSRNVIDFRNYRKFGAESSVTYTPTP